MSKYIALCIILPILMFFVLQYSLQVKNTHIKDESESIVAAACEQAKGEGYFTDQIINNMKTQFNNLGLNMDKVVIEVTTTPKYRLNEYDNRELIAYKIGIPIDNLIAAHSFWGLSDEENSTIKYFTGKLGSERLLR